MASVILGPREFLHTGIHGALRQTPPASIDYVVEHATHTFIVPAQGETPFTAQAAIECVDFGEQRRVVHSAFWPVLDAPRWLVETDDLGIVLFCSHYAYNPEFGRREAQRSTRSERFAAILRARFANMITAFAHESCRAVLVNSAHEQRRAFGYLSAFPDPRLADIVREKVAVLYPAVQARPRALVARKWATGPPLTIVFCGRFFDEKRGDTALRAFARVLRERPDTTCIYIGEIPDEARLAHRDVLARIRHHPTLTRAEVLACFDDAHILLHPGMSESVGAVFIEAAAAGLAVITASGYGYEHIHEWFGDGGAVLVDRRIVQPADEPAAFTRALLELTADPDRARRHGYHNHRTATEGCLSIDKRDALLTPLYADDTPAKPLRLTDFVRLPDDAVLRLTSRQLTAMRDAYLAAIGFNGSIETPFEL